MEYEIPGGDGASAVPDGAQETVLAWHFTSDTLRDNRPIPAIGEWLVHEGKIEICETGLHASERLIDALSFAPGEILHRVECRGIEGCEEDKLVCRERRILWSIDATDILRAFARRVALDVAHLWVMPPLVREYLETGNEDLRAAAGAAARAAAWAAAWAGDAARSAARSAAWAGAAAGAAAGTAVRAAAWVAVRDAASSAARSAARAAAVEKYNGWLVDMVRRMADEGLK